MRKKLNLFMLALVCMMMFTISTFAASKSSGNLNINMTYKLRGKTDCIQGNPFLCVYLSNDSNHYFVRLNYNGTVSKATIKNPVVGTYQVQYFTPQIGKDAKCGNAVSLDAIPNTNIFREIIPYGSTNRKSLYAGGTMNLSSGPSTIKITNGSANINLKTDGAFDNVIPAYYIKVTGTKLNKIKDYFHLYLYQSDEKGTQGKLLEDVKRKKNRHGYFRNLHVTNPGHYYYLIKEKVPETSLTTDKPALIEFVVDYAGERLCAKKVNIKKNGKTRTISITTDSSYNMIITVKDPDVKNAEYLLYGPIKDTYPDANKDGTYNGTKKKMTKSGTSFSIKMKPPVSSGSDWYSYNIVKKVNGEVQKGYTINIPFRWSKYPDGVMITTWRVRPRVEFVSVSSKK